ncbi:hypothetical protein E4T42_07240 [Aureobasidium subglaciale]|nr:hypothetical protein E4T42_07240 [Aureobasidium subglaciale]
MVYRIAYEACGTWMYWIIGTYDVEIDKLALTSALLRSGESFGSTMSYAVGSMSSASMMVNLIVAAVMWFGAVTTTTWSAWQVKDVTEDEGERSSSDGETGHGVTKEGSITVAALSSIQIEGEITEIKDGAAAKDEDRDARMFGAATMKG